MAITKTYLGRNPDGSPHYHYQSDGHVMVTGKVYGVFTVPDGTDYDVSDAVIEVDPKHAGHLSHLIGISHEDNGHPDYGDPQHPEHVPYVHVCEAGCAELGRTADETVARFEERAHTAHPHHAARVAAIRNAHKEG